MNKRTVMTTILLLLTGICVFAGGQSESNTVEPQITTGIYAEAAELARELNALNSVNATVSGNTVTLTRGIGEIQRMAHR